MPNGDSQHWAIIIAAVITGIFSVVVALVGIFGGGGGGQSNDGEGVPVTAGPGSTVASPDPTVTVTIATGPVATPNASTTTTAREALKPSCPSKQEILEANFKSKNFTVEPGITVPEDSDVYFQALLGEKSLVTICKSPGGAYWYHAYNADDHATGQFASAKFSEEDIRVANLNLVYTLHPDKLVVEDEAGDLVRELPMTDVHCIDRRSMPPTFEEVAGDACRSELVETWSPSI